MPERTSYEPGAPSWVDLGTPDLEASKRFYGELFGWQAEESGPVEQTGGYAFFTVNGRKVAGVGPLQSAEQPPAWSVYIATDDVEALAERARQAGATLFVEPMDILDAGRMLFFAHPAAGMLGAWQPGEHKGAELVGEPVSMAWVELHTRDLGGAKAAGRDLFGWQTHDQDFEGGKYTLVRLGDADVAGMVDMPPGVPEQVPAYWATFFEVEDCDATVAKAQELGATVTMPPMEATGVGRFAFLTDPQGAQLGVIASEPGAAS